MHGSTVRQWELRDIVVLVGEHRNQGPCEVVGISDTHVTLAWQVRGDTYHYVDCDVFELAELDGAMKVAQLSLDPSPVCDMRTR